MATGVLVLGSDRATRLLGHLALHGKSYDATIRLGSATITDDADGDVVSMAAPHDLALVDELRIVQGLTAMTGTVRQRPSSVSAVKVDGRRAYARVRDGEQVELPEREVEISRLEMLSVRHGVDAVEVDISVACSSGTYIRAIARDLGQSLGVGGHLTALRRTSVGPFTLAEAVPIDRISEGVQSMDDVARRCFPVVALDPEAESHARHGRPLSWPPDWQPDGQSDGQPHRPSGVPSARGSVYALMGADGTLIALAEPDGVRLRYLAVLSAD